MDQILRKHKAYETWVIKNPDLVRDLESALKWSSFLVGRATDSNIMAELAYSISNLMVFYHDRIITGTPQHVKHANHLVQRIKVLLTIIDHSEVFVELICRRWGGKRAKWISITLVQLIKFTCRLYLFNHSKDKILAFPPIPFSNRSKKGKQQSQDVENITFLDGNSFQFKLKRSGRIMRKVEGAPPLQYRSLDFPHFQTETLKSNVQKKLLFGELVYVTKPLIHLIGMYLAGGSRKWQSYVLALSMDLLSLSAIYQYRAQLNKAQRLELSRRCVRLLLYLVRSPFYEDCTKKRLDFVLNTVSNVPIVRLLSDAIRDYMPYWQQTYFYLWSV